MESCIYSVLGFFQKIQGRKTVREQPHIQGSDCNDGMWILRQIGEGVKDSKGCGILKTGRSIESRFC